MTCQQDSKAQKMPTIAVFGEALIDFKAVGPLAYQGYPGGSPFNVAVAAARLAQPVTFLSQISTDMLGGELFAYLETNSVQVDFLFRSNDPSTVAFVDERDGNAHFQFLANGSADSRYDPQPRTVLPESVQFIQFGSISLLAEPAATAILETVKLHQNLCLVMFDPNCRPALTPNRARYLQYLVHDWIPASHIVKVSDQDLTWLHPGIAHAYIAGEWLSLGAKVVIVTKGDHGSTLFRPGKQPLDVPANVIAVVDTVGAGDSFTAACMVRILELGIKSDALLAGNVTDAEWINVLQFATAVAAINCTKAGANAPRRGELSAFLTPTI